MTTSDSITCKKAYDYQALELFFEDIMSPQETALYLDHLLHFLVYFEHKEDIYEFYHIYSEIFELKQVLQAMVRIENRG
jgi:hypothetical protein